MNHRKTFEQTTNLVGVERSIPEWERERAEEVEFPWSVAQ